MKLKLLILVVSTIQLAMGKSTCYSCGWDRYNPGNSSCYKQATAVPSKTCSSAQYCCTNFTIVDGLAVAVARGCSSDTVSSLTKCNTKLIRGRETTTCLYYCTGNLCNTQSTQDFVGCPNCVNGYCDYLKGKCVCPPSFSGTTCSTARNPSVQQCIQCSNATETTCTGSEKASDCADPTYIYCIASQARLYDASEKLVQTVISRGCTRDTTSSEECTFLPPADPRLIGYVEQSCTRTCAENGCNKFTPDGTIPALFCYQCDSRTRLCKKGQKRLIRCPIDQQFCYSRVTYRTIPSNYNNGYQEISIERGCTNSSMTPGCANTAYPSSNGFETTCKETCQTQGCNDGWPTRPRCYSCTSSSSNVSAGSDSCLYNPTIPRACQQANHKYCVYTDRGENGKLTSDLADNRRGYPRTMVRSCSATDIGSTCTEITSGGTTFEQCNKTCTTDGCNHGMGGSSKPVASFFVLCLPTLLMCILQNIV